MDQPEKLQMLVQKVVTEAKVSAAQLARDAELSPDAIHSWTAGRRVPQPDSLRQLAAGLRRRAGVLEELACELEGEAE